MGVDLLALASNVHQLRGTEDAHGTTFSNLEREISAVNTNISNANFPTTILNINSNIDVLDKVTKYPIAVLYKSKNLEGYGPVQPPGSNIVDLVNGYLQPTYQNINVYMVQITPQLFDQHNGYFDSAFLNGSIGTGTLRSLSITNGYTVDLWNKDNYQGTKISVYGTIQDLADHYFANQTYSFRVIQH